MRPPRGPGRLDQDAPKYRPYELLSHCNRRHVDDKRNAWRYGWNTGFRSPKHISNAAGAYWYQMREACGGSLATRFTHQSIAMDSACDAAVIPDSLPNSDLVAALPRLRG